MATDRVPAPPPARDAARPLRAGLLGLALALGLASLGCESELPPGVSRKVVTLKDVPEAVMASAKKSLPGIAFQDAWANVGGDGKLHSYEIRGRAANGKIREVRVSPTGDVLEME